ncbi:MAG: 30S ribosomal protein S5 [Candidatus Marinimicrobia bacterium]|nr:30S ribosomal protein S5 [Candidatus Neomarinimicrobiota bacterium]
MKYIDPTKLELLDEKVIKINRVSQVVKGGRTFGFNAVVAVGDGKGHVGIGLGKAKQVINAIAKGKEDAKKNIVKIPIINGTIPHTIKVKYDGAVVMLKPASPGTGVIAGSTIRAIMDQVGVRDILTKCIGSNNVHNVVKATMKALLSLRDPYMIAKKRGKTVQEIFQG